MAAFKVNFVLNGYFLIYALLIGDKYASKP